MRASSQIPNLYLRLTSLRPTTMVVNGLPVRATPRASEDAWEKPSPAPFPKGPKKEK
jgi:hypothetical protein